MAIALIREHIAAAGGWLAFDRFMELALYEPGLGYYSAGSLKIGPGGDFTTAPEVSDLFSRCVARQCAEVLAETGGSILELGAGTGRMAGAVLEALRELHRLPERYLILETSADLAERQRARIGLLAPELRARVAWLERLPETPQRGVILANEVLDALPFKRFTVAADVRELGVVSERDSFAWQTAAMPMAPELRDRLPRGLPHGYVSEICPLAAAWIASLARCLDRGGILLFDYGLPRLHYYHPQRTEGTLRCHFKQRAHSDPFINIAVQDITAWVDFTHVAQAAVEAGLAIGGFATQAGFLLAMGIEQELAMPATPLEQARRAAEARKLLLPGEMGEAFKAMALTRNLEQPVGGFRYQDLRGSL